MTCHLTSSRSYEGSKTRGYEQACLIEDTDAENEIMIDVQSLGSTEVNRGKLTHATSG